MDSKMHESTASRASVQSASPVLSVAQREANEVATYQQVGRRGRSALSDENLEIPQCTIDRYRGSAAGKLPQYALEQMIAWAAPLEGVRILEICCHNAEYGTILAKLGANVVSIDIAEPLIELARRRAELNGVADRLRPVVMSVHDLEFADDTFDIVFGKAALHHLDLVLARNEIHRVMKPGGVGIFSEPVVFSPFLQALRPWVPVHINRESPDERQLSRHDLELFCKPFASKEFAYFRLVSRLGRIAPWALAALTRLDTALLAAMPRLQHLAGNCAFRVVKGQ